MLGGSCAHSHLQAVAGIDRRHLIGREFAHVASLSFLEFSVKVVRHKNWISFCGGLWKRNRRRITPGVRHVEAVVPTFRKPRKVGAALVVALQGWPAPTFPIWVAKLGYVPSVLYPDFRRHCDRPAQILLDNSGSGCSVSTHLASFSFLRRGPEPQRKSLNFDQACREEPNDDKVLCKTVRSGRNGRRDRPCGNVD